MTGLKASRSRPRPTAQVRQRLHLRCHLDLSGRLGRAMLTFIHVLVPVVPTGFGLGESARTEDKKTRSKNATFGVFERLYAEAYKEPNFAEKKWENTVKSKVIGPQWRPSDGGKSRATGGGASGEPQVICRFCAGAVSVVAVCDKFSCFGLTPRVRWTGMGFH